MPKNRVAFLAMEADGVGAGELLCLTGFTRCGACGYVVHTEALTTLPEHYCTRRQERDRVARSQAPDDDSA